MPRFFKRFRKKKAPRPDYSRCIERPIKTVRVEPSFYIEPKAEEVLVCPMLEVEVFKSGCYDCPEFHENKCQFPAKPKEF
jgi:hypothetical protein